MGKNNLVVIELDKARTLKFGNKALKKIEKMFKCKITKLDLGDLGIDEIIQLVHIGLVHEEPDLTISTVDDLLDEHLTIQEILEKVMEAFTAAFGKSEVKEEVKKEVETSEIPNE